MSERHSAPVEGSANMDYSEHEKTYNHFLAASKYGTIMVCVVMLAMAVGFFTTAGFFGGLLVFIILMASRFFVL